MGDFLLEEPGDDDQEDVGIHLDNNKKYYTLWKEKI
jgi:hypothetical protein